MDGVANIQTNTYGETVIDPLALSITLAMGAALIFVRRDRAIIPFAVVACTIPVAQRVVIADLDFTMLRILILCGWVRILITREIQEVKFGRIDRMLAYWLTAGLIVQVLRDQTMGAFVYRAGYIFDAAGAYFLFRSLLRSPKDVEVAIRGFVPIAILSAGFMLVENQTGRNMFSVFGGVPEITFVRDGRLRCQGAFSHPIMAGAFGASLFPLFLALLIGSRRGRPWLAAGLVSSVIMTGTSASSGPAMAFLGGFAAICMWPLRSRMQQFRWALSAVLIFLHFAGNMPLWHLIHRVGTIIGGTGYHRYRLIDAFVNNFSEWVLLGSRNMAYWGWGLQDITNQFVLEGVNGGLLGLTCFVLLLARLYGGAGLATRFALTRAPLPRPTRQLRAYLSWGLGATLTVHMVAFISVSYFGQVLTLFFMALTMIACMNEWATQPMRSHGPARGTAKERAPLPGASSPSATPVPSGLSALINPSQAPAPATPDDETTLPAPSSPVLSK